VKIFEHKENVAVDRVLWDVAIELLENRNMVKFRAPGVSMSPFIRNSEMITVEPCSHGDLTFGDIILYHGFGNQCGQLSIPIRDRKIVHRFLWRRKIGGDIRLITKGDNNYLCDPPVSPHQILGKVVEIEKNGWRLRLDTPFGRLLNALFALVIMPPVSALSFACIRTIKRLFTLVKNNRNSSNDCAKEIRRRQL
jgi:signal peptidase I